MGMELKYGLITPNMKDIIMMVKKMVKENYIFLMGHIMMVNKLINKLVRGFRK